MAGMSGQQGQTVETNKVIDLLETKLTENLTGKKNSWYLDERRRVYLRLSGNKLSLI